MHRTPDELWNGIRELTLEADDPSALERFYRGPVEHDGGDRSVYLEDPEGNVLEIWDFFEREPAGVDALAD